MYDDWPIQYREPPPPDGSGYNYSAADLAQFKRQHRIAEKTVESSNSVLHSAPEDK